MFHVRCPPSPNTRVHFFFSLSNGFPKKLHQGLSRTTFSPSLAAVSGIFEKEIYEWTLAPRRMYTETRYPMRTRSIPTVTTRINNWACRQSVRKKLANRIPAEPIRISSKRSTPTPSAQHQAPFHNYILNLPLKYVRPANLSAERMKNLKRHN